MGTGSFIVVGMFPLELLGYQVSIYPELMRIFANVNSVFILSWNLFVIQKIMGQKFAHSTT